MVCACYSPQPPLIAIPEDNAWRSHMPARKPKPPDDPEEYRRFLETAREVEADETPGAMDLAFQKVRVTAGAGPAKGTKKRGVSGGSK